MSTLFMTQRATSAIQARAFGVRARKWEGASLLEVLVAVSLLAVSLLALAAAQLAALRDAEALGAHERASWFAASIAEAMRSPEPRASVLERWRASIASVLPGAHTSIIDGAIDVGTVVVHWERFPGPDALQRGHPSGVDSCVGADTPTSANCVALPFVSGE